MHDEATTVLPQLIDVFEIRRPILVGHSDGASIALIYAGSVGKVFRARDPRMDREVLFVKIRET